MKGIEIINAGAGSGKTYRLTEQISESVRAGDNPAGIMAITFTRKAAAELDERIRGRLIGDDRLDAAFGVGEGLIGTVHSVCGRLLQEYALDAGLSPVLKVISEDEAAGIFRIAVDEALAKFQDRLDPAAVRLSLDGRGQGYAQNTDWRDDLNRLVEQARANHISPAELIRQGKDAWTHYKALLGQESSIDIDRKLMDAADAALPVLRNPVKVTKKSADALDALERFMREKTRTQQHPWKEWVRLSKLGAAKGEDSALDDVRHWAGRVTVHSGFQADLETLIEGLFACAAEALSCYREYKARRGLADFTDQETLVLELIRNNPHVRQNLTERLSHLYVDEFQDTSPIQLALFLELHRLASRTTWVGDPKQAIYGFRGADPVLMTRAAETIGTADILPCSWRSKEALISFFNDLFPAAFTMFDREKVVLEIPEERSEAAKGGSLEEWLLQAANAGDEAAALACGIDEFLSRHGEYAPADIAVLCRSNKECGDVSAALAARGIRSSVRAGALTEAREIQLALAGLRYLNDPRDSLALAEIAKLHGGHRLGSEWLKALFTEASEESPLLKDDPLIRALDELRAPARHWTPEEAVSGVIHALGLYRLVQSWSDPDQRRANLTALIDAAREYAETAGTAGRAVSPAGFVQHLGVAELPQGEGGGRDAVQVLTYHRAKGLEWPVVILYSLGKAPRESFYGVRVEEGAGFDLEDPLKGRELRYTPWPFGAQKRFEPLSAAVEADPDYSQALEETQREAVRLLYVGMTRAREGLIFALRPDKQGLRTAWLDCIKDEAGAPLLGFPRNPGREQLLAAGTAHPVSVHEYLPEDVLISRAAAATTQFAESELPEPSAKPHARLQPSELKVGETEAGEIRLAAELGDRFTLTGKLEPQLIGNLIHAAFAVEDGLLEALGPETLMSELLQRSALEGVLSPESLLSMRERLTRFIAEGYPRGVIRREWPLSFLREDGARIQGWCDMLIETETGFAVIDHKSYAGDEAEAELLRYIPQLEAYSRAVAEATGKENLGMFLHLPLAGRVYRYVG